jgi:hypothetical protein
MAPIGGEKIYKTQQCRPGRAPVSQSDQRALKRIGGNITEKAGAGKSACKLLQSVHACAIICWAHASE